MDFGIILMSLVILRSWKPSSSANSALFYIYIYIANKALILDKLFRFLPITSTNLFLNVNKNVSIFTGLKKLTLYLMFKTNKLICVVGSCYTCSQKMSKKRDGAPSVVKITIPLWKDRESNNIPTFERKKIW